MFVPRQAACFITLLLCIHRVELKISVMSKNSTDPLTYFYDTMAAFSPDIEGDSILGYVVNIQPEHACKPVVPPPNNTSVWIALIARGNCSFVDKVLNVQNGYAAAIIYNYKDNDDVKRMNGESDGVKIPATFVGYSDGMLLKHNYCYSCSEPYEEPGYYEVKIEEERYINPYMLWPFLVVVGTCFVMMLLFMVVKWCRDIRKRQKSRLSAKHLKKIPTKKFKKGDEYDVCAICLDDYEEGDKLRLLPCSHVYHTKCIDPWLTKNKRSCPICKRKVIPGEDPDDEDSDSSDDGETNERTPLLSSTQSSSSNNRRSTFDNSGLPEAFRQPQVTVQHETRSVSSSSSSSDSEELEGAVGGVASTSKLGQQNILRPFQDGKPVSSVENAAKDDEQISSSSAEEDKSSLLDCRQQKTAENHAYVVEGEGEESDEELSFPDSDVVYSGNGVKREEKKTNGVV